MSKIRFRGNGEGETLEAIGKIIEEIRRVWEKIARKKNGKKKNKRTEEGSKKEKKNRKKN
jgi:hypothetical protein